MESGTDCRLKAKVKTEMEPAVINEASERIKKIAILEIESVMVLGNERNVTLRIKEKFGLRVSRGSRFK